MNKLKKKLKVKHILPVYRCDIIEHAKELSNGVVEYSGICFLLHQSLFDFHYYYDSVYDIKEVFPLLTLENARIHGGDCYSVYRFNKVTINSDEIWLEYV